MHRFLLNPKKNEIVDHINHNRVDNRLFNLRICNAGINGHNQIKQINLTSKYKGVYFENSTKKYRVEIQCNKKRYKLGRFNTDIEAAEEYNKKAKELYGENVNLNIIEYS